jgi:hypothetical protein
MYVNLAILVVLIILTVLSVIGLFVPLRRCAEDPVPLRSADRLSEEIILDLQYGKDNQPSKVYQDMFVLKTPYIGGYNLADDKTYTL